jgi:hypothetical protein
VGTPDTQESLGTADSLVPQDTLDIQVLQATPDRELVGIQAIVASQDLPGTLVFQVLRVTADIRDFLDLVDTVVSQVHPDIPGTQDRVDSQGTPEVVFLDTLATVASQDLLDTLVNLGFRDSLDSPDILDRVDSVGILARE